MEFTYELIQLFIEVIIFLVLVAIGTYIYNRITNSASLISKQAELLPEDEIHTLKQVFYLIIMSLAFANMLYSVISYKMIYFLVFDISISLFLGIMLDKSSIKGKLILLLLVPYDSLNMLLLQSPLVSFIDIIHFFVFIYFVKMYYDKFREYTESNSLSITILVLFLLIFISFIITQIVEGVNPLDSLVMVSNAFTSNGYAVLGTSITGKINALILVWGGYILSGVGTATLAAAILTKHFNHKFADIEESNRELKESIKRLEDLIKSDNDS